MYFSTELNNFYQLLIHCVYNGMFRIGLKTHAFNFFPIKKVLLEKKNHFISSKVIYNT